MRRMLLAMVVAASTVVPVIGVVLQPASVGATTTVLNPTPIASIAFNPAYGRGGVRSAFLPDGRLLVTDGTDGTIIEMNADGTDQQIFASGLTEPDGIATYPGSSDPGFVVVTEAGSVTPQVAGKVDVFSLTGTLLFSSSKAGATDLGAPQDVAIDPTTGDIFVATFTKVYEYVGGNFAVDPISIGGTFSSSASFAVLTVDPANHDLYVGDQENSEILVIPGTARQTNTVWLRTWTGSLDAYVTSALAVVGSDMIIGETNYGIGFPQLVEIPLANADVADASTTLATMGEGSYTGITVAPAGITGGQAGDLFVGTDTVVQDPNSGKLVGDSVLLHGDANFASPVTVVGGSPQNGERWGVLSSYTDRADLSQSRLYANDVVTGQVDEMTASGSGERQVLSGFAYPYSVSSLARDDAGSFFVQQEIGDQLLAFGNPGGTPPAADRSSGVELSQPDPSNPIVALVALGGELDALSGSTIYQAAISDHGADAPTLGTWSTLASLDSPGYAMVDDGSGHLLVAVASASSSSISVLNATSGLSTASLPLPLAAPATALAEDSQGRVLATTNTGVLEEVGADGRGPEVIDQSANLTGLAAPAGVPLVSDGTAIDAMTLGAAPTVTSVTPGAVHEGDPNVTVVVKGTGSTAASVVNFVAAGTSFPATPVTSISGSELHVPLPAGLAANTYDVEVSTAGGTSADTSADRFQVIGVPPTVTSVSPSSGPTAGGGTISISGHYLTGLSAVSFGTTPATSFHLYGDSYVTAVVPPHAAGTVDLRLTTSVGTSVTTAADHFTYLAPGGAKPVVNTVSPAFGAAAGGTVVTITGTNFGGATAVHLGPITLSGAHLLMDTPTKLQVKTTAFPTAGAVPVSVTTAAGTSASNPGTTFAAEGTPTVTKLTPATHAHGVALTIMVSGTSLLGAKAVTLIASNGKATSLSGAVVLSFSQLRVVVPKTVAKGTYTLVVTTAFGSSAKGIAARLTLT